jgi:phosphate transport system permease protein
MAVAFVLGNNHQITSSLFDAAATITVTLANEFSEADTQLYLSALFHLALLLFVLSLLTLAAAKFFILRSERRHSR